MFTTCVSSYAGELRIVTHNDSQMLMHFGEAGEDVSQLHIYYYVPSKKMKELVAMGTPFFKGFVQWDDGQNGTVKGEARVFKWGCNPLEYEVVGIFHGPGSGEGELELRGLAPVYTRGVGNCYADRSLFNHNSTLIIEPMMKLGR